MTKLNTMDYVFSNSYIGNFVSQLMTKKDLLRVASAKDLETAGAILRDFGYGDAKDLTDGRNIEDYLRKERSALRERVFKTVPDPEVFRFDLLPYDYHNVKVCLKSELLDREIDPEEDLNPDGSIPADRLLQLVRDRNSSFLSPQMKAGIAEALDVYNRGKDPQTIDLVLDRACYREMLDAAKATESDFLIGFVKIRIDAANLGTFLRLRQLGRPWSFFRDIYLEGGNIPLQLLIGAWEEPYARVAERLDPYGFRAAMADGARIMKETGSFTAFEKFRDDAVMKYVKDAKYIPFGPEPVEGYWYAKTKEIDNLRIALTGNYYGFSEASVEERLRETYV